jgi:hypothetical protein
MVRWVVNFVPSGAEYLGTVTAATERDAFKKAAATFHVKPERIVLTRLDDPEPQQTDIRRSGDHSSER